MALQNAPGAVFRFPDGEIPAKPGDCSWFDNSVPHSVHNDSGQERLALIVCIRSAAFSAFKQEQGKIPTKNQMTKKEAKLETSHA
uniref:aspartyl/asparaginyl beta-hydroxylase domain-containing protein n=1 Tax=Massilia sp. W12 TaxID=3126507 RepID=UPI00403FB682